MDLKHPSSWISSAVSLNFYYFCGTLRVSVCTYSVNHVVLYQTSIMFCSACSRARRQSGEFRAGQNPLSQENFIISCWLSANTLTYTHTHTNMLVISLVVTVGTKAQ